jgi:hypothetical protein
MMHVTAFGFLLTRKKIRRVGSRDPRVGNGEELLKQG